VAYFDQAGRPLPPDEVPLTARGRRQASTAGAALAGGRVDCSDRSCLRGMGAGDTSQRPRPGDDVSALPP
jgi:hypothetical protein